MVPSALLLPVPFVPAADDREAFAQSDSSLLRGKADGKYATTKCLICQALFRKILETPGW
jgi:hypothetical protein